MKKTIELVQAGKFSSCIVDPDGVLVETDRVEFIPAHTELKYTASLSGIEAFWEEEQEVYEYEMKKRGMFSIAEPMFGSKYKVTSAKPAGKVTVTHIKFKSGRFDFVKNTAKEIQDAIDSM